MDRSLLVGLLSFLETLGIAFFRISALLSIAVFLIEEGKVVWIFLGSVWTRALMLLDGLLVKVDRKHLV